MHGPTCIFWANLTPFSSLEDGGRNFVVAGFLGPEPAGFQIMPASVRLPCGTISPQWILKSF